MSGENGTGGGTALAGGLRGPLAAEPGDLVRPALGQGPMAGPADQSLGSAGAQAGQEDVELAIRIGPAALDALVRSEALRRLNAIGLHPNERHFHERAVVDRYQDGGVRVRVVE